MNLAVKDSTAIDATCLAYGDLSTTSSYNSYDLYLTNSIDDIEKRIDLIEENLNRLEESKMSKFKVGDIVRVKAKYEIKETTLNLSTITEYENTIHAVSYATSRGYYQLEGCGELWFDEHMIEYAKLSKYDITSINVIVPDKVVEIEFCDGKEKMICHKEDTFDLRKCCFIAISKHLYKKEYTYEGIEHMADQLMYQKKYVKVVDKALKDYYKKEAEKERMRKEEEENKIVRERQALRKKKYKKRREQRYRDEMVNLIATAIKTSKFFD